MSQPSQLSHPEAGEGQQYISIDYPLDGQGAVAVQAGQVRGSWHHFSRMLCRCVSLNQLKPRACSLLFHSQSRAALPLTWLAILLGAELMHLASKQPAGAVTCAHHVDHHHGHAHWWVITLTLTCFCYPDQASAQGSLRALLVAPPPDSFASSAHCVQRPCPSGLTCQCHAGSCAECVAAANTVADHAAASALRAGHMGELRHAVQGAVWPVGQRAASTVTKR